MGARAEFDPPLKVVPGASVLPRVFARVLWLTRMNNSKLILSSMSFSCPVSGQTIATSNIIIRFRSALSLYYRASHPGDRTFTSN